MTADSSPGVLAVSPLRTMPWATIDPFLFCVHHHDAYPAGDERMAPVASLAGRELGADFAGKDGWRMYHGQTVPGNYSCFYTGDFEIRKGLATMTCSGGRMTARTTHGTWTLR